MVDGNVFRLLSRYFGIDTPINTGKGKKLFDNDADPSAFSLIESTVTSKGVILANYKRNGKVTTGNAIV